MATSPDPALVTAALAATEGALNRALALDPRGRDRLGTLAGRVFALHCNSPPVDVYLQPGAQGIRLMGAWDGPVTTSIRGEASDFAELATATDPAAALINGGLALAGDSAPLIELQTLLRDLDIDWEAPLVDALGDVAGHQLAQLLRGTARWGRQASASLGRQLEEFIHEEARLSPPRLELEDFFREVQDLELRVERLGSRAARLRKRLQQLRG